MEKYGGGLSFKLTEEHRMHFLERFIKQGYQVCEDWFWWKLYEKDGYPKPLRSHWYFMYDPTTNRTLELFWAGGDSEWKMLETKQPDNIFRLKENQHADA